MSRIQIKLNGRRFEFDPAVAKANCSFFRDWYSAADEKEARDTLKPTQHDASSSIEFSFERQQDDGLDVFSFKFLPTLVPDYFGGIQVAMRKDRMPPFTWEEMNRGEQEAVAWIVKTFGIDRFLDKFLTPSAPEEVVNPHPLPSSSSTATNQQQQKENGQGGQEEAGSESDKQQMKAKHPGMSAEQLASITLQLSQAKQQSSNNNNNNRRDAERQSGQNNENISSSTGTTAAAATATPTAQPQQQQQQQQQRAAQTSSQLAQRFNQDDSDDENLVLQGVGCYYCGVATHSTEQCPVVPVVQAAEKLVQQDGGDSSNGGDVKE